MDDVEDEESAWPETVPTAHDNGQEVEQKTDGDDEEDDGHNAQKGTDRDVHVVLVVNVLNFVSIGRHKDENQAIHDQVDAHDQEADDPERYKHALEERRITEMIARHGG